MTPMKARRGISGEQIEAIGSLPRSLAASLTVSRPVQRGTCAPPPEGVDVGYPLGLPGDGLLAADMRLLTLAFFITPRDFSFPVYAQG